MARIVHPAWHPTGGGRSFGRFYSLLHNCQGQPDSEGWSGDRLSCSLADDLGGWSSGEGLANGPPDRANTSALVAALVMGGLGLGRG